ncbi:MAG: hypothetical protein JO368_10475, partial [Acidimicrobiales bacterium]|nr:hypothetical protein [Acidimicrobiales bacterium]
AGDRSAWCRGQVLFAGGPETAVVGAPRLMEVVRTDAATSLTRVLETVLPSAFARSEKRQLSDGGGNPRFGAVFEEPAPEEVASGEVRTCAVVSDRPALAAAIGAALEARSITALPLDMAHGFEGAAAALRGVHESAGPVDAVVAAPAGPRRSTGSGASAAEGWAHLLAEHDGIEDALHADGAWARAVADYAGSTQRPVRLVTVVDATTAGGRSRAQAAAQLARVGAATTEGRVAAFAAGLEAPEQEVAAPAGELVAHLVGHPEASALAGSELVVGPGWLGLRSHPRPLGAVTYGGAGLPDWLDGVLREMVGADAADAPAGRAT